MTLNVKDLDPKDRFNAAVKRSHEAHRDFLVRGNRCPNCVLVKPFCVCEKLEALKCRIPEYRIAVLMNQREQYRSSNTAKVIERIVNGEIFIDGLDEGWNKFQALLEEYSGRVFVLFPSETSVEYSPEVVVGADGVEKLIVVVDGTWRQARRLNLKIPKAIPRVRIQPSTLSKFLCRRQTRVDRVCTAEALALLLLDMEMEDPSTRLDTGLSELVECFNLQCYRSTLRPQRMLKHPPQLMAGGTTLPPRHPDSLIDPS